MIKLSKLVNELQVTSPKPITLFKGKGNRDYYYVLFENITIYADYEKHGITIHFGNQVSLERKEFFKRFKDKYNKYIEDKSSNFVDNVWFIPIKFINIQNINELQIQKPTEKIGITFPTDKQVPWHIQYSLDDIRKYINIFVNLNLKIQNKLGALNKGALKDILDEMPNIDYPMSAYRLYFVILKNWISQYFQTKGHHPFDFLRNPFLLKLNEQLSKKYIDLETLEKNLRKPVDEIQVNTKPTIDYSNIGPYESEYTGNTSLINKEGDEILSPNYKISVCNLGKQYVCFTPGGDDINIYLIEKKYIKLGGKDTWFLKPGDDETTRTETTNMYINYIKSKMDKGEYQILKPKINEIQVQPKSAFQIGKEYLLKQEWTNHPFYKEDQHLEIKSKKLVDNIWFYIVENDVTGERYTISEKRLKERLK